MCGYSVRSTAARPAKERPSRQSLHSKKEYKTRRKGRGVIHTGFWVSKNAHNTADVESFIDGDLTVSLEASTAQQQQTQAHAQ